MIDNIIADAVAKLYEGRIKKVSKNSGQNYSERVRNENGKEIYIGKNISPKGRQKIIHNLDINIIV